MQGLCHKVIIAKTLAPYWDTLRLKTPHYSRDVGKHFTTDHYFEKTERKEVLKSLY